jgi:hypothetical protein
MTATVKLTVGGVLRSSVSETVQVTVVVPIGKVDPEAGRQLTVALAGLSSSTTVGGVYVTAAPLFPVAVAATVPGTFANHRSVSRTVTVN